jgi:tetratricopeptide (TPR) repeat protein
MDDFEQDVDQRLDELDTKGHELTQACAFRSANRVANEIRRMARAENRVIAYLNATFTLMNQGIDLLDPEGARDAALEMVSLLESEDRARSIQPNLPEAEYERVVSWSTSCAYDNLAKATATLHGYNSEGIHACIADGIQVCRQTGKLQCVACFREYATDVYAAADDLDMAMHYARSGVAHEDPGPHDRRWAGARDVARLLLLTGQIDAAAEAMEQALKLADTWHTARYARLQTKLEMLEVAHLLGDPGRWEGDGATGNAAEDVPPPGEFVWYEMRSDQVDAVAACCAGEWAKAIELLTTWDRQLTQKKCSSEWFENRLRLVSVHRLAGNDREFERLAEQLGSKAEAARDWLTLRCLKRLNDPSSKTGPVPLVNDLTAGLFAPDTSAGDSDVNVTKGSSTEEPASSVEDASENEESSGRTETPSFVQELQDRLRSVHRAGEEDECNDSINKILTDIMSHDPAASRPVGDARWLIHTVRFVIEDGARGGEIWPWAESIAASFRQDAVMLSLLATLGCSLRFGPNEDLAELINEEQLETMFRESLDLDPSVPRNFDRAGDYFLFMENLGEAERCFARGFRLDRGNSGLAKSLAQIYRRTERERDALTVLDMCLREGCDDPDLPWQAALSAQHIGQHEATLTYLDAYEKLEPDQAWVNYYRAAALLELERPAEALAAADAEAKYYEETPFHVAMHRVAALAGLGRQDEFCERLRAEVLTIRFSDVDYLTPPGLCSLFGTLWTAAAKLLGGGDDLLRQVEDLAISAGLMPDEMFEPEREGREPVEDVNFYECTLQQPLDERWTDWHARLPDEVDWQSYLVRYGVLALTDEDASRAALAWQERAYPLAAKVMEIEQTDEGYRERVGVVWQGFREEGPN